MAIFEGRLKLTLVEYLHKKYWQTANKISAKVMRFFDNKISADFLRCFIDKNCPTNRSLASKKTRNLSNLNNTLDNTFIN